MIITLNCISERVSWSQMCNKDSINSFRNSRYMFMNTFTSTTNKMEMFITIIWTKLWLVIKTKVKESQKIIKVSIKYLDRSINLKEDKNVMWMIHDFREKQQNYWTHRPDGPVLMMPHYWGPSAEVGAQSQVRVIPRKTETEGDCMRARRQCRTPTVQQACRHKHTHTHIRLVHYHSDTAVLFSPLYISAHAGTLAVDKTTSLNEQPTVGCVFKGFSSCYRLEKKSRFTSA